MEINDLAKSYNDLKAKKDEKRRVIDYVHAKKLKELESKAFDVNSRLTIAAFKNDIRNDEELYEQYNLEFNEIEQELKSKLQEVNATNFDRLTTHLYNQVYLDTYLDEEGYIVSSTYHKI